MPSPPCLKTDPDHPGALLLSIKAVPGSRRNELAGVLGERLKVRVAAPPEDGKANRAIVELLAETLGVRAQQIEIVRGHASPEKTVRIVGVAPESAQRSLHLGE